MSSPIAKALLVALNSTDLNDDIAVIGDEAVLKLIDSSLSGGSQPRPVTAGGGHHMSFEDAWESLKDALPQIADLIKLGSTTVSAVYSLLRPSGSTDTVTIDRPSYRITISISGKNPSGFKEMEIITAEETFRYLSQQK
ncbi:hypothetical protein GC163_17270 [bacterium]|nr:hypothetical protein [bacterium]